MAGGKETPRQKMIGMMYLVLTALLALNVSKSILDAFVAIEENIQTANLTELFRGDEKKSELVETAQDKTNPGRAAKADLLAKAVEEIDNMTAKRIKMIDDLKMEILSTCGEDVTSVGKEGSIITTAYSTKNPIKPARMNLEFVAGKDKYDEPMQVMGIAESILAPQGKGLELWNSYNEFRKELLEKVASTQVISDSTDTSGLTVVYDAKYSFKAPVINKFKDQKDLKAQIKKAVDASNVHPDDKQPVMDIYASLTKNERSTVHDVKDVHWVGKTFDHSPSVAAIASLSSLQKDILAARAQAVALLRLRVGGGEYSFNKIIPLAYGPEVVNNNEEFTVEVLMAAYDSDKQPEVTYEGNKITEVRDGKGFVRMKLGSTKELTGTVSIMNKSGIKKTLPWKKNVTVMKPSGSIELPELNVLYRGYDNIVNITASGYPSGDLSVTNASKSKKGDGYVVRPGKGKTSTLTVMGKTIDGKSVRLKSLDFRVQNMPDPQLFWGGKKSGDKGNKNSALIQAKYGPGIPLKAEFKVLKWKFLAPGLKGAPPTGVGGNISSVSTLVRAVKAGTGISFVCDVRGPDGITRKVGGTWSL